MAVRGQEAADGAPNRSGEDRGNLRICVICGQRVPREVLCRALALELEADVEWYASCEDALCSEADYDVLVVYDYFGMGRMNGPQGVLRLRAVRPRAYIIGVTSNPGFDKQFLWSGADFATLMHDRPIKRIVALIRARLVTTLYPPEARSPAGSRQHAVENNSEG